MQLVTLSAYPVTFGEGESGPVLHIRFEELVSEMLCEECKHQAGSLWIWDKLSSHQKLFSNFLGIRKLLFT